MQYRRFCLIAEFFGCKEFCCAVAAVCLLFDLYHSGTEFISAYNKHFVVTGINGTRHRNVTLPLVIFPENLSRKGFYSNNIAQSSEAILDVR